MSTPTSPPAKARRCNADYRWTLPKVTAFLEALAESGRVAEAARAVGMSRQAAYKLRARLDGPRFRAAFENARKTGIHARMAASRGRPRSRWEGPGIAALDHLRQGDMGDAQGDGSPAQGDTSVPQGDRSTPQGDAIARKATKVSQGQCNNRSMSLPRRSPERRVSARIVGGRRAVMFIAAYWWKVHPGKEAQFRKAWRRGTELIAEKYGSLGSRLHWEELDEGEGGRFVGVAEWPDRATWQAAFDAKMVYDEPETRAAFVDAIADTADEPLLLMEVTDDLLARE